MSAAATVAIPRSVYTSRVFWERLSVMGNIQMNREYTPYRAFGMVKVFGDQKAAAAALGR